MEKKPSSMKRIILLLIPILIGALVFVVLMKTRKGPPEKEKVDPARMVRIIQMKASSVRPRTTAYGTVKPTRTWQAVARVSGEVIYTNPLFEKGQRIKAGTLLIEIDPIEYKISVAEAEANIQSALTQIKQLKDKESNNKALLKLEQSTLQITKNEVDRQKRLLKSKISSKSAFDQAEKSYIAQKYKMQTLENAINSMTSEFSLLTLQKKQAELRLESANIKLSYTKIRAPFDCVIASTNIEKSQFVQMGQKIAEADNLDTIEIEAQISNGLQLFGAQEQNRLENIKKIQKNQTLSEIFGIAATVRTTRTKRITEYPAKAQRFNAVIDTKTRTPGIIIQVDDPFQIKAKQPKPPLIKGMYCEIELVGKPIENLLIIPRSAVHDEGTIYLADENNTLQIKKVTLGFSQGNFSVVRDGLKPGDRVVITDLIPAVQGMSLKTVIDTKTIEALSNEAMGGSK